jgi:hypothetical protein
MICNIQRKQRDCISTTAKTRFSMGNIDAKSSLSFFFASTRSRLPWLLPKIIIRDTPEFIRTRSLDDGGSAATSYGMNGIFLATVG